MKPKEYFQGVWGQNLDSGFQKQSYHNQVKFEKKKKKKKLTPSPRSLGNAGMRIGAVRIFLFYGKLKKKIKK